MNYEVLSKVAMDNLDFICYITDITTNKLIYLNNAARKIFNFEENQYDNLLCHKAIHGFDKQCSFCDNNYLKKQRYLNLNVKIKQNNKNYSVQSTIVDLDGKPARLSVAFDITQFTGELDFLEDKLSAEQTLLACINAFIQNDDLDVAINKLLSIVAEYYGAHRASLFKLDKINQLLFHTHEWVGKNVTSIIALTPHVDLNELQFVFDEFKEKNKFICQSTSELKHLNSSIYNLFKKLDIDRIMMMPIHQKEEVSFILTIDNPQKDIENYSLLESVAAFIKENIRKRKFIDQLETLSYTDTLTNVFNRNKYQARLEEIDTSKLKSFGVVHVDANSLKKINEIYGLEHGDSMLKNIASILTQYIPHELYRIAGDEFVGFCFDMEQEDFENLIKDLRINHSKNPDFPFAVGGIWQNKNINIELAISQSGEIMLAEKQHYYKNLSDALQYSSHSTELILSEIRDGKYHIYLQPKLDLLTGEIAGAEALIRKFDENNKVIPPDKFLPIYELEGTIRFLDFFVFEQVCKLLNDLIEKGKPLKIAVNFSRVTFMIYDLVDEIVKICDKYKVPHEYIKVEITESIDKLDFDFFAKKLQEVHAAGFDVSLDDFGAKHSNLMMLSRAEFTEVKIDKGLVDNIAQSAQNRVIIRNIIKIIKELGTSICVAEGIETIEQKEILQELGCTYGQGYYFYRPLPLNEFLHAYEQNAHKSKLSIQDVTEEYLNSFDIHENIYPLTVEHMPLGYNLWNERTETVACNAKSVEIFNLNSHQEFLTNFFFLSPEFQPDGRPTAQAVLEGLNEVRYSGHSNFYWLHCDLEGNEIPCEITLKKINPNSSEHSDYVIGFTRDLRKELSEDAENPEKFFYNTLSTKELLSETAELGDEVIWHFNNKTNSLQFYGKEFDLLNLSHKKLNISNKEDFSDLIFTKDIELFDEFLYRLKTGMKKECEIRFVLASKQIQKYKIFYKVIFDEEANATHCVGKMLKVD